MRRQMLAVFLFIAVGAAFGWGNEGHKAINRAAAQKVPPSMPSFLRRAGAQLEYVSVEPDRWRGAQVIALKNAQEPDHYIDMERLTGLGELPRGRYEFYRLLYERRAGGHLPPNATADELLPERVGLQPYIVMEIFDRLKIAFRDYRELRRHGAPTTAVERNIVFYAGWLGHYVGDGSNPLHTTVKYDGWLGPNPRGYTTRRGLHARMETEFVAQNLGRLRFADLLAAPSVQADPWPAYWQYLRESNGLVEKVYQLEQAGGFTGAGTPESRQFIRQRLAAGAQMLVNLWYTAWLESGKVVVSGQ